MTPPARTCGCLLRHCRLRRGGAVARLGGDEFAVLMEPSPDSPAGALVLADRVLEAVRDELTAIVNIGRVLSLVTIAEGIEQPEQLAMVRELGYDLVQGYLPGRPQSSEEYARLLASDAVSLIASG